MSTISNSRNIETLIAKNMIPLDIEIKNYIINLKKEIYELKEENHALKYQLRKKKFCVKNS